MSDDAPMEDHVEIDDNNNDRRPMNQDALMDGYQPRQCRVNTTQIRLGDVLEVWLGAPHHSQPADFEFVVRTRNSDKQYMFVDIDGIDSYMVTYWLQHPGEETTPHVHLGNTDAAGLVRYRTHDPNSEYKIEQEKLLTVRAVEDIRQDEVAARRMYQSIVNARPRTKRHFEHIVDNDDEDHNDGIHHDDGNQHDIEGEEDGVEDERFDHVAQREEDQNIDSYLNEVFINDDGDGDADDEEYEDDDNDCDASHEEQCVVNNKDDLRPKRC